jgi:uncharacterized membrane protein YhhN
VSGINRGVLAAAILAGVSYYLAERAGADGIGMAAWKGAGVGLLALGAAMAARSLDGWLLAAVLFLHAAGDILLEDSLVAGGVAFFTGHLIAVALYRRNRRLQTSGSQRVLAGALLVGTPLITWLTVGDLGATLYSAGVGAMAAAAWTSRFPRYRLGVGAVLFVISDLFLFARMGPLAGPVLPDLLVWPTYFLGQVLIATAGVRVINRWRVNPVLQENAAA